jgi:hypothetical protein
MLEHFVTNVGNTSKKMLEKKMLAKLPKNVDEKMLANFRKMLTRKNVGNTSEKC